MSPSSASFLQSAKSNIRINTNAAILFIVSQGGNALSLHVSCVRVLKDRYTYQADSVFAYIYHNIIIMIRSPAMERGSILLHLRKPSTKKVILLANYQAEKKMGTIKTLMVKKIEDSSKCHVEMEVDTIITKMISPVIKEAKRTKTVGQEKITVKPALRTLHNYVEFSLIPQKTLSYKLF